MTLVNIYQAKTQLSKLIQQSLDGKEVVIAKAGKPMVKLTPIDQTKPRIKSLGALKGKIKMTTDFDAADAEIEKLFYDSQIEPTT